MDEGYLFFWNALINQALLDLVIDIKLSGLRRAGITENNLCGAFFFGLLPYIKYFVYSRKY